MGIQSCELYDWRAPLLLKAFGFYLLKYVVHEFILIDMREFTELAEDGMLLDPV